MYKAFRLLFWVFINKAENVTFFLKLSVFFHMKSFTWMLPFINHASVSSFSSFGLNASWGTNKNLGDTLSKVVSTELVRDMYHKEAREWLLNLFVLGLYFHAAFRDLHLDFIFNP